MHVNFGHIVTAIINITAILSILHQLNVFLPSYLFTRKQKWRHFECFRLYYYIFIIRIVRQGTLLACYILVYIRPTCM